MDKKELKLNHIVQFRKELEPSKICMITNIGDDYVDVLVANNNSIESMTNVNIDALIAVDIIKAYILALGFDIAKSIVISDLSVDEVFLYQRSKKKVYVVKKDDGYHLLKYNEKAGQCEVEDKLLTIHCLQNEMSTSTNMVDSVDKNTLLKLSQRYDIDLLDKDKYCEFQLIK